MTDKFIPTQTLNNGGVVGIMVNEYQGTWAVASAYQAPDADDAKMRWCFPQVGRDKPGEKAIPVKLTLGKSAFEACKVLLEAINAIDPNFSEGTEPAAGGDFEGDDSIPF